MEASGTVSSDLFHADEILYCSRDRLGSPSGSLSSLVLTIERYQQR